MKRYVLLLCLLLFPSAARAGEFGFAAHTFASALTLRLQNERGGAPPLNLKEALEIADIDTQIWKLYPGSALRLSYLAFNYAGKRPLLDSSWGDVQLRSDLGLQYGGLGLTAPLWTTERLRAGLLLDVKAYTVRGEMGAFFSETELLSTGRTRFHGVAPTVGLAAAGDVGGNLRLYGEIGALPLGAYGSLWEADAGFRYQVRDAAFFQLGYRALHLTTRNRALATELTMGIRGPYFGLNFDFR